MCRLILELALSPDEAYQRLEVVINDVNLLYTKLTTERHKILFGDNEEAVEHEDLHFRPEKDNVVFASALDGFGFRLGHFASLYSQKLGIDQETLHQGTFSACWNRMNKARIKSLNIECEKDEKKSLTE